MLHNERSVSTDTFVLRHKNTMSDLTKGTRQNTQSAPDSSESSLLNLKKQQQHSVLQTCSTLSSQVCLFQSANVSVTLILGSDSGCVCALESPVLRGLWDKEVWGLWHHGFIFKVVRGYEQIEITVHSHLFASHWPSPADRQIYYHQASQSPPFLGIQDAESSSVFSKSSGLSTLLYHIILTVGWKDSIQSVL